MLNISNPSRQNHIFMYRDPVNNLLQYAYIGAGRQTAIGERERWTVAQQAKVIEQLERFGARDAAEAHGRMTKMSGLLYRDSGQIETDEILTAHEAEMRGREDRSAAAATNGALAFGQTARKASAERPAAKITETLVEQELPRGQRPRGDEVRFALSVDPEAGRSDVKLPTN